MTGTVLYWRIIDFMRYISNTQDASIILQYSTVQYHMKMHIIKYPLNKLSGAYKGKERSTVDNEIESPPLALQNPENRIRWRSWLWLNAHLF